MKEQDGRLVVALGKAEEEAALLLLEVMWLGPGEGLL